MREKTIRLNKNICSLKGRNQSCHFNVGDHYCLLLEETLFMDDDRAVADRHRLCQEKYGSGFKILPLEVKL